MEPVIRSHKGLFEPHGASARLVWLDDNPPTCTMTYLEIDPGKTSPHHIHEWEHEVYIIEGTGTLMCDGKDYPVRAGDAIYVPPNVDHYTLNSGGPGVLRRIEVNPLIAAQSGGAQNDGGKGTGQPPVIRHLPDLGLVPGPAQPVIAAPEGAENYIMAHRCLGGNDNSPMHGHEWEHMGFILSGSCLLIVDGKEYTVTEGDAVLVPPHADHEWRAIGANKAAWLVFNPLGGS